MSFGDDMRMVIRWGIKKGKDRIHFVIVHPFARASSICVCVMCAKVLAEKYKVRERLSEVRSGRHESTAAISSSLTHESRSLNTL